MPIVAIMNIFILHYNRKQKQIRLTVKDSGLKEPGFDGIYVRNVRNSVTADFMQGSKLKMYKEGLYSAHIHLSKVVFTHLLIRAERETSAA